MNLKIYSTFLFVFFSAITLKGQNIDYSGYFSLPMNLPFNLAGNFGEIRGNHFHSGIDIKTNEKEGQAVMAAADGYVSRIKVSAFGFGKVLYINHPNGYTTVYAHLQRFNENIAAYVDSVQYANESFETDVMPERNLFAVKQGQIIAFSGNTGGSDGPHLHFEIRDQATEHPVNPLLFGFLMEDTIPPVIQNIKIYQLHDTPYGFITDTAFIAGDTVVVFENTAFSVETFDLTNKSKSHLQPDKIELLLDGKVVYTYHFFEFGFDETKYVNANIDFSEKISGKTYTLLYHLPGNNFSPLISSKGKLQNGVIMINDNKVHEVEIRALDFKRNVSNKKIYMVREKSELATGNGQLAEKIKFTAGNFISYKQAPLIKQPDISISFPSQPAVYNLYPFNMKREMKLKGTYSALFSIGEKTIPIHTFMFLSLKPDNLLPELFSKTLIVSMDEKGNKTAEESSYANGWVTGKTRRFGKFAVAVDTLAPKIKTPVIATDNKSGIQKLIVNISDDLSGIKTYRATLNGKWILMEYDYRTGELAHYLKQADAGRKAELIVEVTDRKANKSVLKMEVVF